MELDDGRATTLRGLSDGLLGAIERTDESRGRSLRKQLNKPSSVISQLGAVSSSSASTSYNNQVTDDASRSQEQVFKDWMEKVSRLGSGSGLGLGLGSGAG